MPIAVHQVKAAATIQPASRGSRPAVPITQPISKITYSVTVSGTLGGGRCRTRASSSGW